MTPPSGIPIDSTAIIGYNFTFKELCIDIPDEFAELWFGRCPFI
jgi:hypothetical protein